MAPIPVDLRYVETVVDPATNLAHRLGTTPPQPSEPARWRRVVHAPERWTARCRPDGDRYPPISAYTATQRGAAACPSKHCFGPVLSGGGAR